MTTVTRIACDGTQTNRRNERLCCAFGAQLRHCAARSTRMIGITGVAVLSSHQDYKFSVTIHSQDLAVVNCLRALSQFSQQTGNNRIPWGGTKDHDWKRDGRRVTFHFGTPEYRSGFIAEAKRLLPQSLWSIVDQDDNDPAERQS